MDRQEVKLRCRRASDEAYHGAPITLPGAGGSIHIIVSGPYYVPRPFVRRVQLANQGKLQPAGIHIGTCDLVRAGLDRPGWCMLRAALRALDLRADD